MKKLFILCGLLLLGASMRLQAATQYSLVVYQTDGTTVNYALSEKIVVTQSDQVLSLTTSGVSVDYALSDIRKFTQEYVEAEDSKIESVSTDAMQGDILVYDLQGVIVRRVAAGSGENPTLLLGELPAGQYIVKVGHVTHKLIKK